MHFLIYAFSYLQLLSTSWVLFASLVGGHRYPSRTYIYRQSLQPCQQEKAKKYYFFSRAALRRRNCGQRTIVRVVLQHAAKKTRHGIAAPGQFKGGVVMMARVAARCQARHPKDPEARRPGSPKPEQLYWCSSPTRSPGQPSSEKRLHKPADSLARSPKSPTPRHPEPEQFPKTPSVAVSSPRTGRLRTINQLLVIFIYILWLMFDDLYIWCYIHHA